MHEVLSRKLQRFSELQPSDMALLRRVCSGKPRMVGARQMILRQGEVLRHIPFILRGWVCASKHLEDGRWQMLSLFVNGDLCDFGQPSLRHMDHALRSVSDTIILDLAHDDLEELSFENPRLGRALRWSGLVQAAIAQEWVLSLGQRRAKERCAHLICELYWRLRAVGAVKGGAFEFPLTQEEVGAAIGVSTVHANRMLQDLRIAKLIEQEGRSLTVLDLRGLETLALFSPKYLHLGDGEPQPMLRGTLPKQHPKLLHPELSLR